MFETIFQSTESRKYSRTIQYQIDDMKNIDQLRIAIHLQDEQFDLISINETVLDDTTDDNEVSIRSYDMI